MSNAQYRLYAFAHLMLSPLQRGLQVAHMLVEMSVRLDPARSRPKDAEGAIRFDVRRDAWTDWATEDKTLLILDGGMSPNLHRIYTEVLEPALGRANLPIASFSEDASLAGALTAVGVLLPRAVWGAERLGPGVYRTSPADGSDGEVIAPGHPAHALIDTVLNARLAGS